MAIHGPRKKQVEKTFYDTLNDEEKKHWRQVLKMMGATMIDVFPFPEDMIRDAINGLHRRMIDEIGEAE